MTSTTNRPTFQEGWAIRKLVWAGLFSVALTDSAAPTGSGQSSACRTMRVLAHYAAKHGINDLQLTLEGM